MKPPVFTATSTLNQDIMRILTDALETDPEVDLLSVFPSSYQDDISQDRSLSDVARLNRVTINRLQKRFRAEPEVDLLAKFATWYRSEYDRYKQVSAPTGAKEAPLHPELESAAIRDDIFKRLDDVTVATVTSPLSDNLTSLFHQHKDCSSGVQSASSLADMLKLVFRHSEKLYEFPLRGAVFKCSDEIVAKVVRIGSDTTEYTALQYLADRAPDIPAPKPHGCVNLSPFTVMFMSFLPSMTLTDIWPTITHDQKLSIQHQLDRIFLKLRQLKQPDGRALGGVGNEGVKDMHREDYRSDLVIFSGADFENWKFSLSAFASDSYIAFLRSFLPTPRTESVFTHGDLRPDNIRVDIDGNGEYTVTGIVDWEDSGFYPDYHECTKATNLLKSGQNCDWYRYLPPCISPHTFSVWWLVDRLWDRNILYGN